MNGRALMIGLLTFCGIFAAALWYFQFYAYYTQIDGLPEVLVNGEQRPVTEYTGLDATSSPLKLRACFKVDWPYTASDTYRDKATPLTAPPWFTCFDAEQIARDLQAGKATAILAGENEPDGVDRYIAQYPDGRAFMWHQLNEIYAN
ncbi:histidine kinase [Rhodobacteraceae bacterium NNCM2]|nr:histidine kinase [Coraliihabitans acroporae]